MKRYFISSIIFLIVFLITFNSCKKSLEDEQENIDDKKIESYISNKKWNYTKVDGVYKVTRTESNKYQVAIGDTISFWFTGYDLSNKVFETNIKSEAKANKLDTTTRDFNPIVSIVGKGSFIKGVDLGLSQLREGEKATLLFPSTLGFGNNAIGPLDQWSPLAYDVNVISISNSKIRKEKLYISSLNLEVEGFKEDTSGLYYKELNLEPNLFPTLTDTIYGWYKGTLPDGTIFDNVDVAFEIINLSNKNLPLGLRLGYTLTNVGTTNHLVVPSYLGYGKEGKGIVEPYQTLFYEIRVDSIKNK